MTEVFLGLGDSVTLVLAVNHVIVFASTFDYSTAVLDQVYSRLTGLEIDSMVVTTNSPFTKYKYENEVELFSVKINDTKYHCVMASEDIAKIQELAKQLQIQSVKLVSELGLGKMVDSSNYCVVTKNSLNYCVMGYRQGVMVGVLLTNSTGFKGELQKFVTQTNTPCGFDLSNLPSAVPEYFTNEDQLPFNFRHAIEVFSFAMTTTADGFSIYVDENTLDDSFVMEEKEEEPLRRKSTTVEENDWQEEEDDWQEEEEEEEEEDWEDDWEDDLKTKSFTRKSSVKERDRVSPEPLILEKKQSPLLFFILVVAFLSLGAAVYSVWNYNNSSKELNRVRLAKDAEMQIVNDLSLTVENIERSQKMLKALRVTLKDKTVAGNLVSVGTEDCSLVSINFTGSKSINKKMTKALDKKFVVSDVTATAETAENGKRVYSVYCSLK